MWYILPEMSLNTNKRKVVIIVGPTASGKSDLALRLAKLARIKPFKKYGITGAEIISADSRQVYRGMDIGTGKVLRDKNPKSKILNLKQTQNPKFKIQNQDYYSSGTRHHLIDIANPKKQFTADDFKKLGEKAIKEILAKGKVPIIVGGTGFYIDILLGRINTAEVPPNKKLRAQFDKLTAEKLFEKLIKLDPQRAKTIDRHNKRRLIRALEIVRATGKPISNAVSSIKYCVLWLGINPDKKELAKRIKKCLDRRLKQGMLKEVQKLHKQGVSWERLNDFGLEYRWISRWLKETSGKRQATKEFKNSDEYQNLLRDIIHYSKRQMTWFKRNTEIHWLVLNEVEGTKNDRQANKLIKKFIENKTAE